MRSPFLIFSGGILYTPQNASSFCTRFSFVGKVSFFSFVGQKKNRRDFVHPIFAFFRRILYTPKMRISHNTHSSTKSFTRVRGPPEFWVGSLQSEFFLCFRRKFLQPPFLHFSGGILYSPLCTFSFVGQVSFFSFAGQNKKKIQEAISSAPFFSIFQEAISSALFLHSRTPFF